MTMRRRDKVRNRDVSSLDLLPKYPQQPRVGQAKGRSQKVLSDSSIL